MARRRPVRLVLLALVAAALPAVAVAQQPAPDTLSEARDRVEELEQLEADARDRVEAARDALQDLTPKLRRSSRVLAEAEEEATVAEREAAAARQREERIQERLAEARAALAHNREELAELARDAYMYGPSAGAPVLAAMEQLSEESNPNEIADVVHMVDVVLGDRSLLIEESVRLIEEANILIEQAEVTRQAREREAAEADAARDRAAERHAEMMALLDEADRAVAVERQALAELRDEQDAVEDRVAELEQEARRAVAAIGMSAAGEGLVTVGGITVAESLAPQLRDLLAAAALDGIDLGGSGYRSPETTAALRRANGCPDVYSSPASACRVPTARPGSSMHEQGLAIDFTWNGQTICYPNSAASCHGNAAFDWLSAHAADYGLYVLDDEAWHWSTNGN
jgi:hypothetical protein